MEVTQERRNNVEQSDNLRRPYQSISQHHLSCRSNTAGAQLGKTIVTRMFQAACSATLSHQEFVAGVPSVARPNMRFKPLASLTRGRLKPAP